MKTIISIILILIFAHPSLAEEKISNLEDFIIILKENHIEQEKIQKIKTIQSFRIENGIKKINFNDINLQNFLGGREGNGGNEIAMNFTERAYEAIKQIKAQQSLLFQSNFAFDKINMEQLMKAVEVVDVFAVDYKLCANENDKNCPDEEGFVAKNYPLMSEIHIDVDKWLKLSNEEKTLVALHEYLGILGVEESNYHVSSDLLATSTDELNYEHASCNFTLIQKDGYKTTVYTATKDAQSFVTGGFLVPLVNSRLKTTMVLSGVITTGYLRIQISEGYQEYPFSTHFKKNGKIIIPETVVHQGSVSFSKKIQKDDLILHSSCIGW